MNAYERMKHEFMIKIAGSFPNFDKETLCEIANALDMTSAHYDINVAETHLAVLGREEFQKVIKSYIVVKHMEGLSEATLRNYLQKLKHFMQRTTKPLGEITGNDVRLYLFNYQAETGVSNRSLDSIRVVISTFLRWATTEGYIPKNPAETLKAIKWEKKPREALEQIELEVIRKACITDREKALIEVLYSTGCRVSELAGIRLSDIDWNAHSVELFGKGRKYRTSYINAKAEVAIRSYLSTRAHKSLFLFCNDRGGAQMRKGNIERMIRVIRNRAGMGDRRITPHTFRHTTATQALTAGMPITDIQRLLGHASVSTTMIYAHTSQDGVKAGHKRYIV